MEDKFCSHLRVYFSCFPPCPSLKCRRQVLSCTFGGWGNGSNSSKLMKCWRQHPSPAKPPFKARAFDQGTWKQPRTESRAGPGSGRLLPALSIHFCTDMQVGCLFHWIQSIWGVIYVWLHPTKFSQIDSYEASNYLLGTPMPKKKKLLGKMLFSQGMKIKKNQPTVAAMPLRAGFLNLPGYPVLLKVAVHTAQMKA